MPTRVTKRGADRTPFAADAEVDVLVCGASFAGLAVARELRSVSSDTARILVLDRYEIGERATSACAAPTEWLVNLGLERSIRQTFSSVTARTPRVSVRWHLPFTYSTFDYERLCQLLWQQCGDAEFDTATVLGRDGAVVHTDRGDVRARMVVDALGWRRVLGTRVQPPYARLSRALEVHPHGCSEDMVFWVHPRYVRPGYGWSFPADGELRVGVISFDPQVRVKAPTLLLAADERVEPMRFQGNWIPHELRPATEDGVFFAGDSAGHCLPLTAEGIRTALYFGVACGRELLAVLDGRQDVARALERYAARSDRLDRAFRWLLRGQEAIRRLHGPAYDTFARLVGDRRVSRRLFDRYLDIAPPGFALPAPPPVGSRTAAGRRVDRPARVAGGPR